MSACPEMNMAATSRVKPPQIETYLSKEEMVFLISDLDCDARLESLGKIRSFF